MVVLYVDDDPEDHEIFKEALRALDQKNVLYSAMDGREALKVLEELIILPDYIFLDINMPKMDGKEFLVTRNGYPRLREIPVIMYTTSTNPKDQDECRNLGALGYVIKPAQFSAVKESLANSLA